MDRITNSPFLLFALSFITLCGCAWFGAVARHATEDREAHEDFRTVLAACLTLLGLIVGFSFSMAVSRYDLRQRSEEAEATAIGTEYARAELLHPADAATIQQLLRTYLTQRILFFTTRDAVRLQRIAEQTDPLQQQLWLVARSAIAGQSDAVVELVVSGMNDVLNSQANTQAAWDNRIPTEAWTLMVLIAVLCNLMLGFSVRGLKQRGSLVVLPLVMAIALFLIADIDSPAGGGLIHLAPKSLLSLEAFLHLASSIQRP